MTRTVEIYLEVEGIQLAHKALKNKAQVLVPKKLLHGLAGLAGFDREQRPRFEAADPRGCAGALDMAAGRCVGA
jgi:hypothetical protein